MVDGGRLGAVGEGSPGFMGLTLRQQERPRDISQLYGLNLSDS